MLHSENFRETTITIDGNEYNLQFDLAKINRSSVRCFGNIYLDPGAEPMEFTFYTYNDKIAGYTPMNATRDLIANIVSTILHDEIPFEE